MKRRDMKEKDKVVTIYDIAKKANVSPMTVSRVINNSGNISEATRKKVEQAIQELGYIPNHSARSLISKETKILSLLITDITNPFFTQVARGAEDKARQMGYRLLLGNSDEDPEKESEYLHMFISTNVDGVLIAPAGDRSKKNLKLLIKHQVPFVLIDRTVEGIKSDQVLGDSREGTRKLIEHLIEQGHNKIALINGPTDISTARERRTAYEETLKLFDLPIKKQWILESDYKQNNGDTIAKKLLSLPPEERPTAIFAANNFIAVNTIQGLKRYNIRIPEDMAIVCFDDLGPASSLNPFLTVAAQPAYLFGSLGIQLLIERIENPRLKEHQKIVLPPEIVIRQSSLRSAQ